MANSYDINDVVRITSSFTSTAGVATNPQHVTYTIEDPAATVTIRTSTSAAVSNPAAGTFYTDVVITLEGVYEYRVHSSGNVRSSTQGWWRVRKQRATT